MGSGLGYVVSADATAAEAVGGTAALECERRGSVGRVSIRSKR